MVFLGLFLTLTHSYGLAPLPPTSGPDPSLHRCACQHCWACERPTRTHWYHVCLRAQAKTAAEQFVSPPPRETALMRSKVVCTRACNTGSIKGRADCTMRHEGLHRVHGATNWPLPHAVPHRPKHFTSNVPVCTLLCGPEPPCKHANVHVNMCQTYAQAGSCALCQICQAAGLSRPGRFISQ